LTNGTLIDDKWAIKIAAHSSFIYFSINAATKETHEYINRGSKWELVLDNIRKVGEARKSLSSGLKIVGHMTIVPKNVAEVPLFIRGFRELGFDKINFGYDWKVPFYLKCHPLVARRIGFEVRREMGRAQVPEEVRSYHLRLLGIA
jgi:MoaA/NifB/PqqE/SkfB family radical SAM enzyme